MKEVPHSNDPVFVRQRPFRMPIRPALLKKHNFFDLYPLDGGGALVFQSIAGEPDDAAITRKVLRGRLLKEWGTFPELDYGALERWRSVEQSCWLNRFYFFVSMARTYALTGDERIARKIRDGLLYFIRAYPPPENPAEIGKHIRHVFQLRDRDYNRRTHEENQADETDVRYIWFDFQPASRIVHILYTLHFLRHSPSLSREDIVEINRSLYRHAEVICVGERDYLPLKKGNHQSLRGLALLYAGAYFEGFGDGREFLRQGIRVCNYHIQKDFNRDGSLRENSPSYHCFETWHMRDAVLLSNLYGFSICRGAEARLERAARFIHALEQPDGVSPTINDGYPVRLDAFLETLPQIRGQAPKTARFPDAGLAVYRNRDRFLVLDASPFPGQFSHYHAGKNAVTLWFGGKPFLIDSGCPNYEDPLFSAWYKTAQAHSSLTVDGQGDGTIVGTYNWSDWPEIRLGTWRESREGLSVGATLQRRASGWSGVSWRRRVQVRDDGAVTLTDTVQSARPVECCLIFNLHPDVRIARQRDGLILRNGSVNLSLQTEDGVSCRLGEGRCYESGRHRSTRQVLLSFPCEGTIAVTTVFLHPGARK